MAYKQLSGRKAEWFAFARVCFRPVDWGGGNSDNSSWHKLRNTSRSKKNIRSLKVWLPSYKAAKKKKSCHLGPLKMMLQKEKEVLTVILSKQWRCLQPSLWRQRNKQAFNIYKTPENNLASTSDFIKFRLYCHNFPFTLFYVTF